MTLTPLSVSAAPLARRVVSSKSVRSRPATEGIPSGMAPSTPPVPIRYWVRSRPKSTLKAASLPLARVAPPSVTAACMFMRRASWITVGVQKAAFSKLWFAPATSSDITSSPSPPASIEKPAILQPTNRLYLGAASRVNGTSSVTEG